MAPTFSTVLIPIGIGLSRFTAAYLARKLDLDGAYAGITTLCTLFSLALLSICALYCVICLVLSHLCERVAVGIDVKIAIRCIRASPATLFCLFAGVASAAECWLLLWAASAPPQCHLITLMVAYTLCYVFASLCLDCQGVMWVQRRCPVEGALVGFCFLILGSVLLFTLKQVDGLEPYPWEMGAGAAAGLAGVLAFALTHRTSEVLCSYWGGTTVTALVQGTVFALMSIFGPSGYYRRQQVLELFKGTVNALLWTWTLIGVVFGFAGVQFYCDESGFFPTCGALAVGAVGGSWIFDAAQGHRVTFGTVLGFLCFSGGGGAMWTRKVVAVAQPPVSPAVPAPDEEQLPVEAADQAAPTAAIEEGGLREQSQQQQLQRLQQMQQEHRTQNGREMSLALVYYLRLFAYQRRNITIFSDEQH